MIAAALPTGWGWLLPELMIGGLILLLLVFDLRSKESSSSWMAPLAASGLLPIFWVLVYQWKQLPIEPVLGGMIQIDQLALLFKGIFAGTAILILMITRQMKQLFDRGHSELVLLILSAALGMFLVASANDFLMLFVALELITIAFYVMTAYQRTERPSLEAGLKYLILGSLASGLFLFGIAFLYGTTGSTQFPAIQQAVLSGASLQTPAFNVALLLLLAGVLFKAACVPFQLWVPDVYEGAPTPVTAFLSVGSKAAGFLVALRIFHQMLLPVPVWIPVVAVLSGLTILYGNLGAIPQKNFKRLLGYSSIGHGGYLLIGIATGNQLGAAAIAFYLVSYLFTNLAVFLVMACFSSESSSDEISAYQGLSRRSPLLAAVLFLALLSLAGVPPLAGFFGKFLLLLAAVQTGHLALAIIGAVAVVISLYYYLLVVRTAYADPDTEVTPISVSSTMRVLLYLCAAGILGIGIWQEPIFELSLAAVAPLF